MYILLERMALRDDYNGLSDEILKKMLLNNFHMFKKKSIAEKYETPSDIPADEQDEIKEITGKIDANKIKLGHITRDRLNVKK